MATITINKLHIRLKGLSAEHADETAVGIGKELLLQLREQALPWAIPSDPIHHLRTEKVRLTNSDDTDSLSAAVARQIAGAIVARVAPPTGATRRKHG